MLHNKTKSLDDKQYYYEFNATAMDQFGVKSKKLWFCEVLGIIFYIKIDFLFEFIEPDTLFGLRIAFWKLQGALYKSPVPVRTILCPWEDVGLVSLEHRVSYAKLHPWKGYARIIVMRSITYAPD
jgi:hypothetical protein